MNPQILLVRYHEIALKGGNRSWFENHLIQNIKKSAKRICDTPLVVRKLRGRILLESEEDPKIEHALNTVFGISSFSPATSVRTDFEHITKKVLEEVSLSLKNTLSPHNFRVSTTRVDKILTSSSMEMDTLMGAEILKAFPQLKVKLKNPELNIGIEIRKENTFVWSQKRKGLGGVPAGTGGHLLCLLSGGLDSPVAALQMLKRGAKVSFIHFYGTPFVGPEVLEKIERLVDIVNQYQPDPMPLYVIPFGKIQEQMALHSNSKMRTLLYRRMMLRLSCEIANKIKAKALITGESLGQVASQTLDNLININQVSTLPVFRPLIGFDKDEIEHLAQKWKTYETSIQPVLDCCTLFADRHPLTHSEQENLEREESKIDVELLKNEGLAQLIKIPSPPTS